MARMIVPQDAELLGYQAASGVVTTAGIANAHDDDIASDFRGELSVQIHIADPCELRRESEPLE
jgi:hypothetical protein